MIKSNCSATHPEMPEQPETSELRRSFDLAAERPFDPRCLRRTVKLPLRHLLLSLSPKLVECLGSWGNAKGFFVRKLKISGEIVVNSRALLRYYRDSAHVLLYDVRHRPWRLWRLSKVIKSYFLVCLLLVCDLVGFLLECCVETRAIGSWMLGWWTLASRNLQLSLQLRKLTS